MTNVNRKQIEEIEALAGLDDARGPARTRSTEDEILDLMAYILSRGDRQSPMFR